MDKFLDTCSPPKLNQEEVDNLNRPVIRSEIECVIKKKITAKTVQDQMASLGISTTHTKRNLY